MNQTAIFSQLKTLLPLAADWGSAQEKRILREGVPLSASQANDAREIGVREPHRVRLLKVDAIPTPTNPILAVAVTTLLAGTPRGLTLQYGIFVRSDCWGKRFIVAHELAHTAQYERLGGFVPFLRRYLLECATVGYSASSLEQEARALAGQVCGFANGSISENHLETV